MINFYAYHTEGESLEHYDRAGKVAISYALESLKRLDSTSLVKAFDFVLELKDRSPDFEKFILEKLHIRFMNEWPVGVLNYIEKHIKGRWKEFEEKMIQENAAFFLLLQYVKLVDERIPIIEKYLIDNAKPHELVKYVDKFLMDRWPEAEQRIAKYTSASLQYAMAINEPFPEGEASIKKYEPDWEEYLNLFPDRK